MLIYSLILFLRHLFYDKGWLKSVPTDVTSVCVGNVAAGGTGKTPLTELIIRTLQEDMPQAEKVVREEDVQFDGLFSGIGLYDGLDFGGNRHAQAMNIAVLSRGYRRATSGFQQVVEDGTALQFGDEPMQVKRKFPGVTVAVDADRVEGAALLAHPEKLADLPEKERAAVLHPDFPKADYIILDDAFQHRAIKPTKSIVLTTYDRPFFKDCLLPLGRLRDLRSRVAEADMVIVTKCPTTLSEWEKSEFALRMGLKMYDQATCTGTLDNGRHQYLLFSTTLYDRLRPVFPEGDPRYIHAQSAVLFTGIANDTPLQQHLCEKYHLSDHYIFPDHHYFSRGDIAKVEDAARHFTTSIVITTEKDAQRLRDFTATPDGGQAVSEVLRRRVFYAPIRTMMLSCTEQAVFKDFLLS